MKFSLVVTAALWMPLSGHGQPAAPGAVPAGGGASAAAVAPVVDGAEAPQDLRKYDFKRLIDELGGASAVQRDAAQQELERRFVEGAGEARPLVAELLRSYRESEDPEQWERVRGLLVLWAVKYSDFGPNHGFLGVQHRLVVFPSADGMPLHAVQVNRVVAGAPAEAAGLVVGDRILMIDDVDLNTIHGDLSFYRYIFKRGGGRKVVLKVLRQGVGEVELSAVLGRQSREYFRDLENFERNATELFHDWLEANEVPQR